jgi:hypothetical protein
MGRVAHSLGQHRDDKTTSHAGLGAITVGADEGKEGRTSWVIG